MFGQALSPEDASIAGTIDRSELRTQLANTIFAEPDGSVTAILGADGNGKSWIFAQAWARQSNRPLHHRDCPRRCQRSAFSRNACRDLLISKLLTQTGDGSTAEARDRWLRHFERWQNNSECNRPTIGCFFGRH